MVEVTEIKSKNNETKSKKKGIKKILFILVGIIILVAMFGFLFFFLTQGQKKEKERESAPINSNQLNVPVLNEPFLPKENFFEKNPLFTDTMKFTINLNEKGRYLTFSLKLGLTDQTALDFLIERLPLTKDIIITTTRLLNSGDLNSGTGIEQFKRTLSIKINSSIFTQEIKTELKDPNPVKKILFEEFIIQ